MQSISLCMIVKNEAEVLGRCLDSVKDVVDEIVIVIPAPPTPPSKSPGSTPSGCTTSPGSTTLPPRNAAFDKARCDSSCGWTRDDVVLPPDREAWPA